MIKAAAVAAGALLLTACAGSPAPEPDRGAERVRERQRTIRSVGEEFRFVWNPEVKALVDRVGDSLARSIGEGRTRFRFYVIDQPGTNAFTTPLGDIFIFSGMLTAMRSSDELAGVLAHEMAHVRADHFARLQKKAALSTIPGFMAAILSRGDPRVIASTIAAAQSYQLHWTRDMELESDHLALQYLKQTGFERAGLLGALLAIERGERLVPSQAPEHLLTHPVTPARIAAMESNLGMSFGEGYRPRPDSGWERMQAVLRALTGREGDVRRRYQEALHEDDPPGYDLLGLVHYYQEDYRGAEENFRIAAGMDTGSAVYRADLGAALFHLGRSEEAVEHLLESLRLEKGRSGAFAHFYLGEIYRLRGETAAAKVSYERAVESFPPISEAHYQLALLSAGEKRLGEADFHFGRAAALRGDFATALRSFRRAEGRLSSDPLWASRIAAELWHLQ